MTIWGHLQLKFVYESILIHILSKMNIYITLLNSQVVSLPLQSVMQVANFCAAMDTLIDQDVESRDWKPFIDNMWK